MPNDHDELMDSFNTWGAGALRSVSIKDIQSAIASALKACAAADVTVNISTLEFDHHGSAQMTIAIAPVWPSKRPHEST